MENLKFKQCVISDVSYGCGLLTFTVGTKGFKRYSTGIKRIREILENTFEEYTANMLLIELYRAEDNSFDDDCNTICRGGHSYFGGIFCRYVVDFYYSSAEHLKDDIYVNSILCVFSVYLMGDTALSDVLLSDGLLSELFAEDTTTVSLGSFDDVQVVENKPFLPLPRWFYMRANIYPWIAVLAAFKAVSGLKDRRKRVIVKPVRVVPRGCYPFRISPYGMPADYYPYKMFVDGLEVWDCRSWVYNMYVSDLNSSPPRYDIPF